MQTKPLDCPHPGSHAFEVVIYNRQVRALLKENETHPDFSDRWADQMRQRVEACDADRPRRWRPDAIPPKPVSSSPKCGR